MMESEKNMARLTHQDYSPYNECIVLCPYFIIAVKPK